MVYVHSDEVMIVRINQNILTKNLVTKEYSLFCQLNRSQQETWKYKYILFGQISGLFTPLRSDQNNYIFKYYSKH